MQIISNIFKKKKLFPLVDFNSEILRQELHIKYLDIKYIKMNFLTFHSGSVKIAQDILSKNPAGNLSSQMVFSLTS
jgi:hypothetical protein